MIGGGLTLLFSRTGQRRAQLWISPLMCMLAYGLLCFGSSIVQSSVIREGIAFTLIGVVLMRTNLEPSQHHSAVQPAETADSADDSMW